MIKFSEIETYVRPRPGVYEIHTLDGVALKVGIARDLRDRLKKHRASRQSGLRSAVSDLGAVRTPSQIVSKSSILAKHLFFDRELAVGYDLQSEAGRRTFLETECRISIEYCPTREAARRIECERERSGVYRYCRDVRLHQPPSSGSRTNR
jgi:hypothetical protein